MLLWCNKNRWAVRVVGIVAVVGAFGGMVGCSRTTTGTATPVSSGKGASAPASLSVSELMAKLRAVDPCSVFDLTVAKRYGPKAVAGRLDLDTLSSCTLQVGDVDDTMHARFRVTLGDFFDHRVSGGSVEVGQAERRTVSSGGTLDTCSARVPSPVDKFVHKLEGRLDTPAGQVPVSGPQAACDAAEAMLVAMVPTLDRLDPAAPKDRDPVLYGKDPCGPLDQIVQALPGSWRSGPITWLGPYYCISVLSDPSAGTDVQVRLSYDRDAEQVPGPDGRHLTSAGLSGIELHTSIEPRMGLAGMPDAGCTIVLTFKSASAPKALNAHLIEFQLHFVAKGAAPDVSPLSPLGRKGPFDSCAETERLAPVVVAAAGR